MASNNHHFLKVSIENRVRDCFLDICPGFYIFDACGVTSTSLRVDRARRDFEVVFKVLYFFGCLRFIRLSERVPLTLSDVKMHKRKKGLSKRTCKRWPKQTLKRVHYIKASRRNPRINSSEPSSFKPLQRPHSRVYVLPRMFAQ